jgi:predicted AAA+ superfamily ATPase
MNKFPIPPPDRRLQKTNYSDDFSNNRNSNTAFTFKAYDDNEYEKYQNMNLIRLKHIEDMRNNILNYKLLNDKSMFLNTNKVSINKCNIILFGPSGSGKSSFIKTLYRAVYGTPYLPPDAVNKLVIKGTSQNEGTLCFCRLFLKEETNESSGIVLCDTRGHIWMNDEEVEQFKLIVEGKVKEDKQIVQEKNRNPFMLFEFWKKDSELFPKEIFLSKQGGLDAIPHNIVLVFDGSIDDIISDDDVKFYRELVRLSEKKGNIITKSRLSIGSCYTD